VKVSNLAVSALPVEQRNSHNARYWVGTWMKVSSLEISTLSVELGLAHKTMVI